MTHDRMARGGCRADCHPADILPPNYFDNIRWFERWSYLAELCFGAARHTCFHLWLYVNSVLSVAVWCVPAFDWSLGTLPTADPSGHCLPLLLRDIAYSCSLGTLPSPSLWGHCLPMLLGDTAYLWSLGTQPTPSPWDTAYRYVSIRCSLRNSTASSYSLVVVLACCSMTERRCST